MADETSYIETELLLASMRGDYDEVERMLSDMHTNEVRELMHSSHALMTACQERLRRIRTGAQRRGPAANL